MTDPDLAALDQLMHNFYRGLTQMTADESTALNLLARHFEDIPDPDPTDPPEFPSPLDALHALTNSSQSPRPHPTVVAAVTILYNVTIPLTKTAVPHILTSHYNPSLALGLRALAAVGLIQLDIDQYHFVQATILDPEGD